MEPGETLRGSVPSPPRRYFTAGFGSSLPGLRAAGTTSFNSLKPAENGKQHYQASGEKYDAALVVQTPVQKTRVDVDGKQSQRGDSNSVL